ncbi:hypothetical protein [Lyngbya aestuarii]|uniref:hypothetical protein n=1 Tax=Lyngbya aestuarii TaxID=118322 RepID=UPI00403D595B
MVDPTYSSNQWSPQVGKETEKLLKHKLPDDPESQARVKDEALAVMRQCISPTSLGGSKTGLVIGYVQSGKTLNFTTVTALACDNSYRIVIIIAGTKTNLLDQSNKRLIKDLQIEERQDWK